jgi:hypothetical protein
LRRHIGPAPPNVSYPFADFARVSLADGLGLSLFHLVHRTAYAVFQPNLNTFTKWVPWTVAAAAVSSATSSLFELAIRSKPDRQKWTTKDSVAHVALSIVPSAGFRVGAGLAAMYLPPADRIGGPFIRSSGKLIAGNTLSLMALLPAAVAIGRTPPREAFKVLGIRLLQLPFRVAVENAIYRSVKSTLQPLALR